MVTGFQPSSGSTQSIACLGGGQGQGEDLAENDAVNVACCLHYVN